MAGALAGPRFEHYRWRGGSEAMLRVGPDAGPLVIALLPLFEEANRTRTFVVGLLRRLAARGIGSVLPDLPGTGDSLLPTEHARIADMRAAAADLVTGLAGGRRVHLLAIRSGALLGAATAPAGRWHLAPQEGPALLRDLGRIAGSGSADLASNNNGLHGPPALGRETPPVPIAGNAIAPALLAELTEPVEQAPGPVRTVRMATDSRPADRHVPGPSLWRRSEPGDDPALAELLADDVADWIAACGG